MWVWVLAGLACLAVLVLLSLCIPLVTIIDADTDERPNASVHVAWLFGVCRRQVYPASKGHADRRRRWPRAKGAWTTLRRKHQRRSLVRLARDAVSAVRVDRMEVHVCFGLEDMLATGVLYGAFSALRPAIRLPPRYRLDVHPSFAGRTFVGQAYCVLHVLPVRLVIPFARFLLSPAGRGVARMALFPSRA